MEDKQSCMLYSYLLDGQGGATEVEESALENWSTEQGVLWTHINFSRAGAASWVMAQGLDQVAADVLTQDTARPRMLAHKKGTILILRGVNMNPGAQADDMISIRIWLEGHRIFTSIQRPLRSVEDVRDQLLNETGPCTVGEFLLMLVERLADRIGEVVDQLEDATGECEAIITSAGSVELRGELGRIRRQTAALRRFLAPQRDALDALYRMSRDLLVADDAHFLREQADRITRNVEDLDLVRERTLVLQEELTNRVAQEQNARMYVLAIVAAIFLPLSFLTGVFGMNVAGLPGTVNAKAFAYLALGMLAVGAGIVGLMRLKRWI